MNAMKRIAMLAGAALVLAACGGRGAAPEPAYPPPGIGELVTLAGVVIIAAKLAALAESYPGQVLELEVEVPDSGAGPCSRLPFPSSGMWPGWPEPETDPVSLEARCGPWGAERGSGGTVVPGRGTSAP